MKHLKSFLGTALLLLATTAQAQSTYSWNASQWTAQCGTFNVVDGKIVGTSFSWGCIQVKNTTPFKLPKRQTFLVIKGENLFNDTNNPNVFDINGTNPGLKGFTINDAKTLAYVDITSILPTETDSFGNTTINSFGVTLDQDGENETKPTISSIELVAADWIDLSASTSNVLVEQGGSALTTSLSTTDTKKSLSFTATAAGEFHLKFTPSSSVLHNNSQVYLILETSNTNTNVAKMNDLHVGKQCGYATNNHDNLQYDLNNGHKIHIISPLNPEVNATGETALMDLYYNTSSFSAENLDLYLSSAEASEVNIYRCGLYNLAEVFKLYPELDNQNWKFWKPGRLMVEKGKPDWTADGTIAFNNTSDATYTTKQFAAQVRGLGNLSSYFTGIGLWNMRVNESESPMKEDIFRSFSNVTRIAFKDHDYKYFPTMNAGVVGYNIAHQYYQYKDGVAPATSYASPTTDGAGNVPAASLTRQFVAGYSSLILPFDVTVAEQTAIGITPYVLNTISESSVSFTEATGTISANTPFIVNVAEAGLYLIPSASTPNIQSSLSDYYTAGEGTAKFVGSYVQKAPDGDYASTLNFGLKADGSEFARMGNATKTSYYRAFLALPASSSSRQSIAVNFGDNEVTGISTLNHEPFTVNQFYNLSGQRVANPTKGLYIINGKKVLMK